MSEQVVALKTAGAKGKGKADALAGLLKAGQIQDKTDGKEFVKKLLEMTKKGDIELDKNGSIKIKNTQIKEGEIDGSSLINIKNLLSQIKLNDKLAIEKSVNELRDAAAKKGSKQQGGGNGGEVKELKKLLELAKNGGVDVKKISVEEIKDDNAKEAHDKKATQKQKSTEKTVDKAVEKKLGEAQKAEIQKDNAEPKTKQLKEAPKELAAQDAKKEIPNLASLLQEGLKNREIPKDARDASVAAKLKEAKKENEQKLQKESGVVAAFKESVPAAEPKAKSDLPDLAELLAKKEAKNDEKGIQKDAPMGVFIEAPKHTENELKGKMAVASEALKNFSQDLKETIDNYKPPLMKVSMEMNPQNLGNVDVTLITRGQNLIVNVTSTQDTMQMFMQNIQEFRNNLMAQGFVSLQMNFNFSENNKEQNNRSWQKQEAAKKYQINGEMASKSIESLDIVMPHPKYA